MQPPKPTLTWAEVIDLEFLPMVEILRGRNDILTKDWAQPHLRAAAKAWHKREQAKEELINVGIEVRRLLTSIQDEEAHLQVTLASLRVCNPNLAEYLNSSSRYRLSTNAYLRSRLDYLESLPNYVAKRGPGVRVTDDDPLTPPIPSTPPTPLPPSPPPIFELEIERMREENIDMESVDSDNEDYHGIMDKLVDTLDSLDIDVNLNMH
jgi:hypothetical protein